MKIIQLTYDTSFGMPDFGEADLVQLLTGWHPVVYSTQPTFKEQETVMLILEELHKGNTSQIEYDPAEESGIAGSNLIESSKSDSKSNVPVIITPELTNPNQATLDAMRAAGAPQAIIDALAQGTLPSSGGPPSSAMIEAMKAGGAPPAIIEAMMKKSAAGQPAKIPSVIPHSTSDSSKPGAPPSTTHGLFCKLP